MDFTVFLQPDAWIALLTLSLLEIILGVDNIIFISIVADRLPEEQKAKARLTGLSLALIMRVLMLLAINWLVGFQAPLFSVMGHAVSGRDLLLGIGGLFLLGKSTTEIHHKTEGARQEASQGKAAAGFGATILQIVALDAIFSLDSILTAVGMTPEIAIMVVAVVISLGIMMAAAGAIANFINQYPSLQILALSFLLLIGFMLVTEAAGFHVPKGYIYFALFFSLGVEMLNMRARRKSAPKATTTSQKT